MPTREIEFHPLATAEAAEAYAWYAGQSEEAALRFMSAIDRAVDQVRASPFRYPKVDAHLRRILLDRFPYSILYSVSEELITVLVVAHASRRPGYWKNRIQSGNI